MSEPSTAEQSSHEREEERRRELTHRVHRMIRSYVSQKVENRTGKTWEQFKASGYNDPDYREAVNKVCMDAFYQIRSRRDRRDFMRYWGESICSVPQRMSDQELERTALDLMDEERWEDVQSLMLASLSAHSQSSARALSTGSDAD